jgi:hypothetical protein
MVGAFSFFAHFFVLINRNLVEREQEMSEVIALILGIAIGWLLFRPKAGAVSIDREISTHVYYLGVPETELVAKREACIEEIRKITGLPMITVAAENSRKTQPYVEEYRYLGTVLKNQQLLVDAGWKRPEQVKMTSTTRLLCPSCGNKTGVPLLWGLPGPEAFEMERRGEIVLGGCDLPFGCEGPLPNLACLRCNHQWHDPNTGTMKRDGGLSMVTMPHP